MSQLAEERVRMQARPDPITLIAEFGGWRPLSAGSGPAAGILDHGR
jgi:hypothetical protein